MDRNEFNRHYEHIFANSKIMNHLRNKNREPLADCIVDIAHYIENKYDRDVAYKAKAYTPHDFKHHISNVIQIADKLLMNIIHDFVPEDLFCFLLACILHDIGMVFYADKNRFYHSYIAAKMVYKKISSSVIVPNIMYKDIIDYAEKNEPILDNPEQIERLANGLQEQFDNYDFIGDLQKQKIAVMILGHSDLKFMSPKKTFNTLDNEIYSGWDFDPCSSVHILAAFLRWADELDLSADRCKGIRIDELPEESVPFWNKLNLVKKVTITPGRITLTIDRGTFVNNQEESYILLKEIIGKLNTERITCGRVFEKYEKPQYQFPEITNESISPEEIRTLYVDHASIPSSEGSIDSSQDSLANDQLSIEDLIQAIKNCIEERHLCKEGHYCLHSEEEMGKGKAFCIRNPLDCNGLLSRHDLLDDIAQAFLSMIQKNKERNLENYVLIGIANSGALIAAHMAAMSGLPFASWVPNNKSVQYTPQEKELEYIKRAHPSKKVVLVIGVNYTGKAISDAFSKIDNVECVVGLINRDIGSSGTGTIQRLQEKKLDYYFLIEGYPIEKCQYSANSECLYGKICGQHTFSQD